METFQATSGRVYPQALKAAPLLRRWTARLKALGVRFEMNHRWCGLAPGSPHRLEFANGASCDADAVVFALGGGSWPQTGSDGGWMPVFEAFGVSCHPLVPANCGWEHAWPPEVLAAAEGLPIKNIHVSAGGTSVTGELLLTCYGIEGGAIYQLGTVLRAMPRPSIAIDFKPTFSRSQLVAKMESVRRDFLTEARVRWRLGDAAVAILGRKPWYDTASLAREAKHCVIELTGSRPLAEAISSAGGVCWSELDGNLQGCFASGSRAGKAAAEWLRARASS